MARRLPSTNTTRNDVAASNQSTAASSTSTYSTRFDARQRELIEQAAEIKKWSPAKLIRESAISRAADIVNASGDSASWLRHLARLVAKQLVKPTLVFTDPVDAGVVEVEEIDLDKLMSDRCAYATNADFVLANRPSPDDQDQIQTALQTCGESFIQMILEAWQALETGGDVYKPKVILGDLSDETEAPEEASPQDT